MPIETRMDQKFVSTIEFSLHSPSVRQPSHRRIGDLWYGATAWSGDADRLPSRPGLVNFGVFGFPVSRPTERVGRAITFDSKENSHWELGLHPRRSANDPRQ